MSLQLPTELEPLRSQIEGVPSQQRQAYIKTLLGKVSRTKAITQKCLDCCCWHRKQLGPDGEESVDSIKGCTVRGCPLWMYRPGSKRKVKHISDAHKAKLIESARKAREIRQSGSTNISEDGL